MIEGLERAVLDQFAIVKPERQIEKRNALRLATKLKEHHTQTYEDSLKVALFSKKILDFIHMQPGVGLYGGLLHDIGKIGISQEILDKSYTHGSKYTSADHDVMKTHPEKGREILLEHGLVMASWVAFLHHKFKLKEQEPYPNVDIPFPSEWSNDTKLHVLLSARMVSIADQYVAIQRDNNFHGHRKLSPEIKQKKLIDANPAQGYLIKQLYSGKILI